ncbi:hypothetical protein [Pseudonocardia parietis]|uniref:Integral membrane sensor domain MASE1 n=1 Tax=Pseudonocardia parietis TaxID=570936 RepID=A0ABS4W5S5_9PSEU|nr:hypothetical protein [Pseudonocardia parietis]MBP2371555.1 integral membrane sensor domain MASE1 [Pseudonocardia parietis]
MVDDNDAEIATRGPVRGPSVSSRTVAVVITALIFGALVYVSNLAPQIFSLQLIYPAAGVGPAFGAWFGFWGGLGAILGNVLASIPIGQNPLPLLPAFLAQGLFMWLPALLYRRDRVRGIGDWVRLFGVSLLASVLVGLILIWNLDALGQVPFAAGLWTIFPGVVIGDTFWMVVLGPIILNVVSPYVAKAGLSFRGFF